MYCASTGRKQLLRKEVSDREINLLFEHEHCFQAGEEKECLMVSSTKDSSKWIFPKGYRLLACILVRLFHSLFTRVLRSGWETDESLEDAARRETLEVRSAIFYSLRDP